MNIKVLKYIAQVDGESFGTVSSIVENVVVERRVAVKNSDKKIVAFQMQETNINRQAAEKIVDRLYYACLIDLEERLPLKFIKLNEFGMKVVIEIARNQKQ